MTVTPPRAFGDGLLSEVLRRHAGDPGGQSGKTLSPTAEREGMYGILMGRVLAQSGAHPSYRSAQSYADLVSGLMSGTVSAADLRPRDLQASAELIARTVVSGDEEARGLAFSLYHRFGGQARMDEALDSIDPAVRGMIPPGDPPERPWWLRALQGATDVLSVGWDRVSAPAVAAGSAVARGDWAALGDLASGWDTKEWSVGYADQDDDGYVDVYEALGWDKSRLEAAPKHRRRAAKGVGVAAEILFDPLTYLTFGMGPAARAALGSAGRGLRAAGRSSEEISAVAASLSRGRGFGGDEATRTVVGALAADAGRYAGDVARERPGVAAAGGNWRSAAGDVPEQWRGAFEEAVEAVDTAGLAGASADWVRAAAARSAARSLRALDRARAGPRLFGANVPWHPSLTPSAAFPGRVFSPQFEKYMGGPRSAVRSVLRAPRVFTPRAHLIAGMGPGVADDFRRLLRPARSDAQTLRETGESPGGRIHDHIAALFMSRAGGLRDPASLTALTAVTFRGADGAAAGLLGWDEASARALEPVRDAWAYADEAAGTAAHPERARAALSLEFSSFGSVWGEQMRAAGLWGDTRRALSAETARRLSRSGGDGWESVVKSSMARRLGLPEGVDYLAHPEVAAELRRGVLSVGAQTHIRSTSNLVTQAYGTLRYLGVVTAANALSLLRGVGFPFNNFIGSYGNDVIRGVDVSALGASTRQAAALAWHHERGLSLRKRLNAMRNWVDESWERMPDHLREVEAPEGRLLLGGLDDLDRLYAHEGVSDMEGLLSAQARAGRVGARRERALRRGLNYWGADPREWPASGDDAYLGYLRGKGLSDGDIEELAHMSAWGVVSGGRSRDILDEFVQRETRATRPDISRREAAHERGLVARWEDLARGAEEAADPAERARLRAEWSEVDGEVRRRGLGHRIDEALRASAAPELGVARHEVERQLRFARGSYERLVAAARSFGLSEESVVGARDEVDRLEAVMEAVSRPLESHADPLAAKVEFLERESHEAAARARRASEIEALQRKLARERGLRERLAAHLEALQGELSEAGEAIDPATGYPAALRESVHGTAWSPEIGIGVGEGPMPSMGEFDEFVVLTRRGREFVGRPVRVHRPEPPEGATVNEVVEEALEADVESAKGAAGEALAGDFELRGRLGVPDDVETYDELLEWVDAEWERARDAEVAVRSERQRIASEAGSPAVRADEAKKREFGERLDANAAKLWAAQQRLEELSDARADLPERFLEIAFEDSRRSVLERLGLRSSSAPEGMVSLWRATSELQAESLPQVGDFLTTDPVYSLAVFFEHPETGRNVLGGAKRDAAEGTEAVLLEFHVERAPLDALGESTMGGEGLRFFTTRDAAMHAALGAPPIPEAPDTRRILDELAEARRGLDELAEPGSEMRRRVDAAVEARRSEVDGLLSEHSERLLTDRQVTHLRGVERSEAARQGVARRDVDRYYEAPEAEYTRRIDRLEAQWSEVMDSSSRGSAQARRALRAVRAALADDYARYDAQAQAVEAWTRRALEAGEASLEVRPGDARALVVSEVSEGGPRGVAQRARRMAGYAARRLERFDASPAEYFEERLRTLRGRRTQLENARRRGDAGELRRAAANELLPELQADEEFLAFQRRVTAERFGRLRERAVGLRLPDDIRADVERLAGEALDEAQGAPTERPFRSTVEQLSDAGTRASVDSAGGDRMRYDPSSGFAAGVDSYFSSSAANEYRPILPRAVEAVGSPAWETTVDDADTGTRLGTLRALRDRGPPVPDGYVALWRGSDRAQSGAAVEAADSLTDDPLHAWEFARRGGASNRGAFLESSGRVERAEPSRLRGLDDDELTEALEEEYFEEAGPSAEDWAAAGLWEPSGGDDLAYLRREAEGDEAAMALWRRANQEVDDWVRRRFGEVRASEEPPERMLFRYDVPADALARIDRALPPSVDRLGARARRAPRLEDLDRGDIAEAFSLIDDEMAVADVADRDEALELLERSQMGFDTVPPSEGAEAEYLAGMRELWERMERARYFDERGPVPSRATWEELDEAGLEGAASHQADRFDYDPVSGVAWTSDSRAGVGGGNEYRFVRPSAAAAVEGRWVDAASVPAGGEAETVAWARAQPPPPEGHVALWRGGDEREALEAPAVGASLTDDPWYAATYMKSPSGQGRFHMPEDDEHARGLLRYDVPEEMLAAADAALGASPNRVGGSKPDQRPTVRLSDLLAEDTEAVWAEEEILAAASGLDEFERDEVAEFVARRRPPQMSDGGLPTLDEALSPSYADAERQLVERIRSRPAPDVRRYEIERALGRVGLLEREHADAVAEAREAADRAAAARKARIDAAGKAADDAARSAESAADSDARIGALTARLDALHGVDRKAPTKLGPLPRGITKRQVADAADEAAWAKTRWLEADRVASVNGSGRRSTAPQRAQDAAIDVMNLGTQRVAYGAENFLRAKTYLAGRRMGLDPPGAADLSISTNFDYDDITPQEYAFKTVASRFYTYPRKLMGFMGEQIANEPARVLTRSRVMLEAAKYITWLSAEDDEMELALPDWIESRPGFYHAGGRVARVRFPLSEYLEPLGGAVSLLSFMRGRDAFAHDDIPRADAVIEAGGWLTSNFFGVVPGAAQYVIESSIRRDLYTGQSLDDEEMHERLNRTAGVLLPGFASGARQGVRAWETWTGESPHARSEAMARILSAAVGAWQRAQTEVDRMGLAGLYSDAEDAVEAYLDEGGAVHTMSELEELGVVQGGQRLRRALNVGDESYPSGAPRRWPTPLTAFDLRELAPPSVSAAVGWEPASRFVGPGEQDFEWGIAEQVYAENGLADSETWAGVVAELAVRSAAEAEAARVSPSPRPRALPLSDAAELEAAAEAARAALERVSDRAGRMGLSVAALRGMVGWLPPVKAAAESMRAGGWSEQDLRAALLKQFAPELRDVFLMGFPAQLEVRTTMTGEDIGRVLDDYEAALMVLEEFGVRGGLGDYWARYAATPGRLRADLGFPRLPRAPEALDLRSEWSRAYDAVMVDAALSSAAR